MSFRRTTRQASTNDDHHIACRDLVAQVFFESFLRIGSRQGPWRLKDRLLIGHDTNACSDQSLRTLLLNSLKAGLQRQRPLTTDSQVGSSPSATWISANERKALVD